MPTPKPTQVPEWSTDESNMTEPSAPQKATGWTPSQDGVSDYDNWFKRRTSQWLAFLNLLFDVDGMLNLDEAHVDELDVDDLTVEDAHVTNLYIDGAIIQGEQPIFVPLIHLHAHNITTSAGGAGGSIAVPSAGVGGFGAHLNADTAASWVLAGIPPRARITKVKVLVDTATLPPLPVLENISATLFALDGFTATAPTTIATTTVSMAQEDGGAFDLVVNNAAPPGDTVYGVPYLHILRIANDPIRAGLHVRGCFVFYELPDGAPTLP